MDKELTEGTVKQRHIDIIAKVQMEMISIAAQDATERGEQRTDIDRAYITISTHTDRFIIDLLKCKPNILKILGTIHTKIPKFDPETLK